MDPLQKEIAELKELAAELKADRAAQKEKEKKDSWTKFVSLTLVCIAVLTAIATLKGGGFTTRTLKEMNEATFKQTLASDEWNLYQAKSIKQKLYEFQLDVFGNSAEPAVVARAEKLKAKIAEYKKEQEESFKKAKELEHGRDVARALADNAALHSREMGLAITFFQVSIALGGICLVVKKKPLWFISLGLGLYAAVQMFTVLQTPIAAAPDSSHEAKGPPAATTNAQPKAPAPDAKNP